MVAVVFLVVLASVILALSTANLRMKQIEYRMKKNFYSNEQVLGDVYHGIGKDVTAYFSQAYAAVMAQVTANDGNLLYKTEGEAYQAFADNFTDRMLLTFKEGAQDSAVVDKLNAYALYSEIPVKVLGYDKIELLRDDQGVPKELVIRKIKVNYKETDSSGETTGYESTITTDIVIQIPYVSFFEDSSRMLDYVLIGNKGIYFNGGSRMVTGNLYAGSDNTEPAGNLSVYRNEDVYGGMNFYGADTDITAGYIISRGDMNIRKSTLKMQMDASSSGELQVWAETLRTVEDASRNTPAEPNYVECDGQLFLANDLELNARQSSMTLKGELYAYNNGIYETREKQKLSGEYVTGAHTQSSAISINGNNSSLNLAGLKTFVVAGKAYVDMANHDFAEGGPGGKEEYATGESLALKANQYIYLAPAECLTGKNPCPTEEPGAEWVSGVSWFAYDKGFIDTAQPLIEKTYGRNGKKYHAYYLNFVSESKKKEYCELVLNMVKPDEMSARMTSETLALYDGYNVMELEQIWEIKEAVLGKVTADSVRSVVQTADGTKAKIYAKGSIVQTDGTQESTQQIADDRKLSVDYIGKIEGNLLKHYQHLCVSLDPMEDFSLLSDSLSAVDAAVMNDLQRPFSVFIDTSLLAGVTSVQEYYCSGTYGKCKTMISGGDCTISGNLSGIVIAKGDIIIENGASVEGVIFSGGRIYVKGSGTLKADRSVVQAILEEEYDTEKGKDTTATKNPAFASTYLKEYEAQRKGAEWENRVTGTDYTDYISYRNWKKGDED